MTAAPRHSWVDGPVALDGVVREISLEPRYAIDTEFHRERTYRPHAALVQVAWGDDVALLDPLAMDLRPFAEVLRGASTAVMHAASQDLEVLEFECGVAPTSIFDTQIAAGFLGIAGASLGLLVREVLEQELPKAGRMTDWLLRPLGDQQRAYAASDVRHLLALHDALESELRATGRLAWAEEEFERLRTRVRAGQDPDEAWWRLKDAGHLRGRSRAVAQAVAAWRERTAAARDRPPRMILPDLAMIAIASEPPEELDQLGRMRGIDGRHLRRSAGEEILAAIREGLAMSPEQLRLPPREVAEGSLRPAITLVSAWIAQLGRNLRMDPALLATRGDVVAFLQGRPGARLAEGWRAELIGDAVRRLAEGKVAIAFEADGRLVLETRSFDTVEITLPRPSAPWTRPQ